MTTTAESPIDIIRQAQQTIEAQKPKLRAERDELWVRIKEIDAIIGKPRATRTPKAASKGKKKGGKRGTPTKDIILDFLKGGAAKESKDIAAAVASTGKSPLIGGVLAALVKDKKITKASRGEYKLR